MLSEADREHYVNRAKADLASLTLEDLQKDPGLAFKPDFIKAFVTLKAYDPAEWARWHATLKKAGVRLRDLENQMKPVRAKLRVVERGATHPHTVASMLGTGCPVPTLVVPEPYSLTPQATDGAQLI